jgi:hypothetical protein
MKPQTRSVLMHPHPNSHHATVHFRHALSISGRGGGGVGLRRLGHDYGAIELDASSSEIKFDGSEADASAGQRDSGTYGRRSIGKEVGSEVSKGRVEGGSEVSKGRVLLDAYGDSLKHVALMLWKQGYGMHQRKVRNACRHIPTPHLPHLPPQIPPPPPPPTHTHTHSLSSPPAGASAHASHDRRAHHAAAAVQVSRGI